MLIEPITSLSLVDINFCENIPYIFTESLPSFLHDLALDIQDIKIISPVFYNC